MVVYLGKTYFLDILSFSSTIHIGSEVLWAISLPSLPPISIFLAQSIAGHSITPARLLLRALPMISRARPPLIGSHGVALHRGGVREGDAGGSRGALLLPLGSVPVHSVRLRHHPAVEMVDLVAVEEGHLW